MGKDDEGHKYEESVQSRGEREVRLQTILGNCRDRGERGARIPRLYKNTKTFYKPVSYPCIVSRYKGGKDEECREREWTIAENECMGG
jgi:hypothetical protein